MGIDPVSIATIAGVVVSAAGSVVSGIQQGQAAKQQSKVYEQQAEQQRLIAEQEAVQYRRQQSAARAATRAASGAAGIQRAGTVLLTDEQAVRDIALGALTIEASGEAKAISLENRARFARQQGRNAVSGGFFRAGGTLLSGAAEFDFGGLGGTPGGVQADIVPIGGASVA